MHRHLLLAHPRERHGASGRSADNGRPAPFNIRSRRANDGALAIVCAPAATYRGYAITVVLDRLASTDRWAGRAVVAATGAPNRPLLVLAFENLPRQRGGDRARLIVLRAAVAAIDRAEGAGPGTWPATSTP